MMWTEADQAELEAAIAENRRADVKRDVQRLADDVRASAQLFDPQRARQMMQDLRRKRFFDQMLVLGDALLQQSEQLQGADQLEPLIVRQFAQAQIENGQLSGAMMSLQGLKPRTAPDLSESREVGGLIGRVYKQRYVNLRGGDPTTRAKVLNTAIEAYHDVYLQNEKANTWHGVNVVALVMRAQADGVAVVRRIDARDLAAEVRDAALASVGGDSWGHVTVAEAHLALDELGPALEAFDRFNHVSGVDAFECASFLRQLEEVWQLREDGPKGSLVVLARAALLRHEGGETSLEATGVQAALRGVQTHRSTLEQVFGGAMPLAVTSYERGLQRSRSVARVENDYGQGQGTAFLVRGADLFSGRPELTNELVVVTNSHVVSGTNPDAFRPRDAFLRFEGMKQLTERVTLGDILFESPVGKLDVTILRLQQPIEGAEGLPLDSGEAPVYVPPPPRRRLYVIGYPEGGPLTMSMEDCFQVGWENPRVHYRTPTRPGSSGSPVLDDKWRVVGLHHAGDDQMQRLNGAAGTYEANEGIWIHAIKKAIADKAS